MIVSIKKFFAHFWKRDATFSNIYYYLTRNVENCYPVFIYITTLKISNVMYIRRKANCFFQKLCALHELCRRVNINVVSTQAYAYNFVQDVIWVVANLCCVQPFCCGFFLYLDITHRNKNISWSTSNDISQPFLCVSLDLVTMLSYHVVEHYVNI